MQQQKKLDRGRLPPDGAAGLDGRRGGTLLDGAVSRSALAARRRARALSARVSAAGHGQTTDLIPPGQRRRARQRGAEYGEYRPPSLAGNPTDGDPGRTPGADPAAPRREPTLLGTLAGG